MIAIALTSITAAQADGFVCIGQQTAMKIKVYNNVQPAAGTRNAAVMIVSSPFVNSPNKTIAKFSDANGTLTYAGLGIYKAKVDLRFNDSGRGGENIAGTKLAQLSKIVLDVDHSYAQLPADKGAKIAGTVSYVKRTGEVLSEKADCTRYLKN
jgi:hypothetical protein